MAYHIATIWYTLLFGGDTNRDTARDADRDPIFLTPIRLTFYDIVNNLKPGYPQAGYLQAGCPQAGSHRD